MANEVKIKVTANTTQAQTAMSGMFKAFTGMNQGIELAQKAGQLLDTTYDALAGTTMKYASVVRQTMRVSGQSAEVSSRMIQMADDLTISTEGLQQAMKGAAQKGIALTTDKLAELSDEYNNLATVEDKNTFLIQKFGRAGLEMSKMMEIGSDKIREMSGAIEENMVLTDAQVDKARELEIQIDTLTDMWEGYKIALGNQVIPVLVDAGTAVDLLANKNKKLSEIVVKHSEDVYKNAQSYKEYATELERANKAADSTLSHEDRMRGYTNAVEILTEAEYESVKAIETHTGAAYNDAGAMTAMWTETNKVTQSYADMLPQLASVQGALSEVTKQQIYNKAAADLDATSALALGRAMGVINESSYGVLSLLDQLKQRYESGAITAAEYRAQVAALGASIDALHDKSVTIEVTTFRNMVDQGASPVGGIPDGEGTGTGKGQTRGYASGGSWMVPPGYNENYPVGPGRSASSGETINISAPITINQQPGQTGSELARLVGIELGRQFNNRRRATGGL